ncbi:Malolactic regulator [Lacticaseibacillus rhamnosus]|nr:Malolactic regulator [Lacticaseibacillus rhamnosus]
MLTRLPAQEPACKDLGRNGQSPAITSKAAYTPAPDRAGSRSEKREYQKCKQCLIVFNVGRGCAACL